MVDAAKRSVRETGKEISKVLNDIANDRKLVGRAKTEYVLNGLKGAIEGMKFALNPDRALIEHLGLMHDTLQEAMGPKQTRRKRTLSGFDQLQNEVRAA